MLGTAGFTVRRPAHKGCDECSGSARVVAQHAHLNCEGSFSDDVVGVARSAARVTELGGATVPFRFDIHALFFSEDAVTLENELHRHFADRALNLANPRKEFFFAPPRRSVTCSRPRSATFSSSPSTPMPPSTSNPLAPGRPGRSLPDHARRRPDPAIPASRPARSPGPPSLALLVRAPKRSMRRTPPVCKAPDCLSGDGVSGSLVASGVLPSPLAESPEPWPRRSGLVSGDQRNTCLDRVRSGREVRVWRSGSLRSSGLA